VIPEELVRPSNSANGLQEEISVRRATRLCLVILVAAMFVPVTASAQTTSAIAGVVRDSSGSVLPGVTVEVSSPALIEATRTAVTDDQGQYRITELRPGTYSVTFTLQGFGVVRHDGIELPSNFTANVPAELSVGTITETVNVSGQAAIVDVQNVNQQKTFSRGILDTVPTNKGMLGYAALVPAVVSPPNAQDVGGSKGELSVRMAIHGGKQSDQKLLQDGMRYNAMVQGGTGRAFFVNPASAEEIVVALGSGGSAEAPTGGSWWTWCPRMEATVSPRTSWPTTPAMNSRATTSTRSCATAGFGR
jgi:hypothetical protein